MASPHKPIHILCLGNSLTEGYTCYGTQFHPYTTTLHHHLTTTLPNPITVLNDGLSGDEILGPNMKPRLLHSLSAAKYSNIQFDWIIILAGRNDLPNPGNTVSDVYAGLKELCDLASPQTVKVLVLNLLESSWENHDKESKNRVLEYNTLIEDGVKADDSGKMFFLDIRSKIPYHSLSEEERDYLWDDGLHMTQSGYEKLGCIIFERLMEIMEIGL